MVKFMVKEIESLPIRSFLIKNKIKLITEKEVKERIDKRLQKFMGREIDKILQKEMAREIENEFNKVAEENACMLDSINHMAEILVANIKQ